MKSKFRTCLCMVSLLCFSAALIAQTNFPPGQLDPTRNITAPRLIDQGHTALPEQYIWNADPHPAGQTPAEADAAYGAPRYFRASFQVQAVPQQATLYVAGPETSEVYVNGKLADRVQKNPASRLKMSVYATDITGLLHQGENILALKVTPEPELSEKEMYFVAKIVPRSKWLDATAVMTSGSGWKSTLHAGSGWQNPGFDDAAWQPVHVFGSIEDSLELYQGNIDSGLYQWPGYIGASSFLAHTVLPARSVQQVFSGRSSYSNLDALTQASATAAG